MGVTVDATLISMVRKLLEKALSQQKINRARIEMVLDLIETVTEKTKEVK